MGMQGMTVHDKARVYRNNLKKLAGLMACFAFVINFMILIQCAINVRPFGIVAFMLVFANAWLVAWCFTNLEEDIS